MIQDLENIVLSTDLPEYGLRQGDLGTVVMKHGDGQGYEVEFVTLDGETVAVISLFEDQVRAIGRHQIASARSIDTQDRV